MDASLRRRIDDVHPQMLRVDGEGLRKKLADDMKVEVGQSVERALVLAGYTKQEAAFQMGYADSGCVSRWCAATERPQFDKLLALPRFEEGWIKARAERNNRIEVATVVTLRERTA